MFPRFDLHESTILLTGSTGHLGQAIARGLCQSGATVLLNSRSISDLRLQTDILCREGWQVDPFPFDITDAKERKKAVARIEKRYGSLDGLVNNAYSSGANLNEQTFQDAYNVIVTSSWSLIEAGKSLLIKGAKRRIGGAAVINVASMYGVVSPNFDVYQRGVEKNPPYYGAAKAGLIQLTRYLACELGPLRIRVNSVAPGPFPATTIQRNDPDFINRLARKTPLGRIGEAIELAGPIAFLLSDAASYITGANLAIDGGWTAW